MTAAVILAAALASAAAAGESYGTMTVHDADSPFVLAAPHGGFDLNTVPIAFAVCRRIGWNCVGASGHRTEEHPINVSRPTENYYVSCSGQEEHTERARAVYGEFLANIFRVVETPDLYVELHGKQGGPLEIAIVGISRTEAVGVKRIFETAMKDAGLGDFGVLIEGVDRLSYSAMGSKNWGTLSVYERVLHIETPKTLRIDRADALTDAMVRALPEAARLLAPAAKPALR